MSTLLTPSDVAHLFDRAPDLTNSEQRAKLSPSAIKAFVKITERWGLNEAQARDLLGGIASSTYHAWKTEPESKKLDQDTLTRISLVIGIYKALHIYFGKPWADQWVTLGNRNSLFSGIAPIDYMIQRGQPGMVQVRLMLDTWRGGK